MYMQIITATQARNNFFNILNSVYLDDITYEVRKSGLPVATISKSKEMKVKKKKTIMDFAGALVDMPVNTNEWVDSIYQARKDGSRKSDKIQLFK